MILKLFNFEENKTYQINEEIDTSVFTFPKNYKIVKIDSCKIELKVTRFDILTRVCVKLEGDLTALCSYTNEPFSFHYKTKEELSFSSNEEDEASFYEPNDTINLNPYIVAIIDDLVPVNISKPGAKKPENGNGYRVLSEDELRKERSSTVDPRWAKLDEIDLD